MTVLTQLYRLALSQNMVSRIPSPGTPLWVQKVVLLVPSQWQRELTGVTGTGFNADEGASLLMSFRGLQAESAAQGEVHRAIAKELESLVVEPFEDWARGHKV